MHIAIITAKGKNQTLKNKNIIDIHGKPSIYYPISAALLSKNISEVFVATNDDSIRNVANQYRTKIINLPDELTQPLSNHGDAIVYSAQEAQKVLGKKIDTVTILLGNTAMITREIIDDTIQEVMNDKNADSCMSVWKAQDDHPYRAMVINEKGYLEPFLKDLKAGTARQSYPDVFFYDQGPWTVRYDSMIRSIKTKEGPSPWWWMGKNSKAIERLWVTGRDTHTMLDVMFADFWREKYEKKDIEYK